MSIYCPKCRKKHILCEYLADVKVDNNCVICAGKHPTKKFPPILGLKATFEKKHSILEPLHAMGAQKSWPQVSTSKIVEFAPYYPNYNAPQYSFQNMKYPQS